jgi:phage-related baseplate assembly protein
MQRFVAPGLDLSRLPPPLVIKGLDYEAIRSARIADLTARLTAAGIPYDTGRLESEPGVVLQEEDAYRELLAKGAINDAARAVMVAFAVGSDLDHLGAFYGVARRLIDAGDPNASPSVPPTYESDAEFRRRVQVAPEALTTCGTPGAYVHHALEASADVVDVATLRPTPGQVNVVLLSRTGNGVPAVEVIDAVRVRLLDPAVKPLTADVSVLAVTPVDYAIAATLFVKYGPDPAVVRAAALASLQALVSERRRIGEHVPLTAIYAAAHVPGVDRIDLASPGETVAVAEDECANCTAITLTTEVVQ